MVDIRVADSLWDSTIFPEGQLKRWRADDGADVKAGDVLAEIRIGEATHEIVAPIAGRLARVASSRDIIEPGSLLARLAPRD
jgi:biotin carboxyl carrier protein